MATTRPIPLHAGENEPPHCHRVALDQHRQALSVLLTGRPNPDDPAVDQFLHYAHEHTLALDELWVARRRDHIIASALLIPCQGRTGMLFLSPANTWTDPHAPVQLIRQLCNTPAAFSLRLIQALLDPAQRSSQLALRKAGFEDLAVLLYMNRPSRVSREPLALHDQGYSLFHWDESHRQAFGNAILATYEDTRDCPALRGVRHIDDILAGHLAAGVFHPELWSAIYDGPNPVGVMLLNEAPQADALELVYLGLSVPYRGKGLARRLLEHALTTARAWGRSRLMLAVDQDNAPAINLYRALGFQTSTRRHAMIRVVGPMQPAPAHARNA